MTATPHPPATPEFGHVVPNGATHVYEQTSCMQVKKFSVGSFDNNVYVIRCTGQNEALIIDGSAGPERVIPELEGARVAAIVITHSHSDHTQKLTELRAGLGDPPVYAHPDGMRHEVTPLAGGETLRVGEIEVQILHTPGHTPNSVCVLARGHLFSGDALFPGGPGNTEGDATRFAEAMRSVDRLLELPDETRVSPGHGLDTTIGRERPYTEVWRARGW